MATDYPRGAIVRVLSRYEGNGRFAPDGYEGEWFVIRRLPNKGGPDDLLVARHADDDGEVFVNLSRIDGDPAAAWRRDQQEGAR